MSEEIIKNDNQLALAERAVVAIENGSERKEVTPIDEVVRSLADFTRDAFATTMESTKLTRALENSLIQDLESGSMKINEKISLYNVERSASNDRLFKLLNPTFQAINEKQRAEIESARRTEQLQAQAAASGPNVQVNVGGTALDAKVASEVPAEVSLGLLALNNLLAAWGTSNEKKESTES